MANKWAHIARGIGLQCAAHHSLESGSSSIFSLHFINFTVLGRGGFIFINIRHTNGFYTRWHLPILLFVAGICILVVESTASGHIGQDSRLIWLNSALCFQIIVNPDNFWHGWYLSLFTIATARIKHQTFHKSINFSTTFYMLDFRHWILHLYLQFLHWIVWQKKFSHFTFCRRTQLKFQIKIWSRCQTWLSPFFWIWQEANL